MSDCKSCDHWQRHTKPPYNVWAGWCRRYPKTIVSGIVRNNPSTDPRDAVIMASHWPVTHEDDECGEWQGQGPC